MNLIKKLKSLCITDIKLAMAEHPEIKNRYLKRGDRYIENKKLNTSAQFWRRKLNGTYKWTMSDIERLKGLLNKIGYEDTITYEDYIPCMWKIRK